VSRVVFGVRPVEELVRARAKAVQVVYVADGYRSAEIDSAVQAAKERGVTVEFRPRQMVAELAGNVVHQGVVAITGEFAYATVEEILGHLAGRTGLDLTNLSHRVPGWDLFEENETIPYEITFLRSGPPGPQVLAHARHLSEQHRNPE